MSDDRDLMNSLVKECISKEGKLDLKLLRKKTGEAAFDAMKHDPAYDAVASSGNASELKQHYMDRYNQATREVLGVVPSDYKPTHGLITIPPAAKYDPKKSLADQGYQFVTKEYLREHLKDPQHHASIETEPHHGISGQSTGKTQSRSSSLG